MVDPEVGRNLFVSRRFVRTFPLDRPGRSASQAVGGASEPLSVGPRHLEDVGQFPRGERGIEPVVDLVVDFFQPAVVVAVVHLGHLGLRRRSLVFVVDLFLALLLRRVLVVPLVLVPFLFAFQCAAPSRRAARFQQASRRRRSLTHAETRR